MAQYVVVTVRKGKKRTHRIEARTPQLAGGLAEVRHPGSQCAEISTTWKIVGRCGRCGGLLLEGESPRNRFGTPRCFDCA